MSESQTRNKPVRSANVDPNTTAYFIIMHLGGPSRTAEMCGRSVNTVYSWLRRGSIPHRQQPNLSESAEAAGTPFPAEWYIRRPAEVPASVAA